jgi:hypothetical protein
MKTRSLMFVLVSLLTMALLVLSCGGGKTTASTIASTTTPPTTSTKPVPTISLSVSPLSTTTTTPPTTTMIPTTTIPPTSSPQGKALSEIAPAVTTHSAAALVAYKGLCLPLCHGLGAANASPFAPTWDGKAAGSTLNPGVYAVKSGSNADHTSRTEELCTTQTGCHAAPVAPK